jgi:hypothetical protein
METSDKVVLSLIVLSIVAVLGSSTWLYLFQKDYDFVVEAECDPATETCFYRDCTNLEECPPNELENYRVFRVRAGDFERCANNTCLAECTNQSITCEEVLCGESEEDECAEYVTDTTEEPTAEQPEDTVETSTE